ncbi:ribosome quality control complex subunit 2-like [Magnolia sinica]|uniref:ribosome quality control complex subunit 2-like n=1 Tax=Magnolia sinica TaxID=86752 RepID=UPI00265924FF|nr:ribosome quality control complex subunit 2-like [Magnolia sinica]
MWKPTLEPFGFSIGLGRQEVHVGIEVIARILGVELGNVHAHENNLKEKGQRDRCAHHLYRQLNELPLSIKMIDEETLNHMKMGPKQRRAHIEEFRDEEEEESEAKEEDEEEEEDEGKGEEETQGTNREPPVTRSECKGLDALNARMTKIEENQGNLERRIKKLSHTVKAILCCVQKEGAPPPSPDSED